VIHNTQLNLRGADNSSIISDKSDALWVFSHLN